MLLPGLTLNYSSTCQFLAQKSTFLPKYILTKVKSGKIFNSKADQSPKTILHNFSILCHCCAAAYSLALLLQLLFAGITAADMVVCYQPKILLAYGAATCILR